jgi:hypothetical protein
MKIIENKVKCKHCNTHLISYVTSGLVECNCGKVAISGGKEKLIRHSPEEDFVEESIIEIDLGEERKKV